MLPSLSQRVGSCSRVLPVRLVCVDSSYRLYTSTALTWADRSIAFVTPSPPSSSAAISGYTDAMSCMNRNKRRYGAANHGARPNNSVGRKSQTLKGGAGGWKTPRPNNNAKTPQTSGTPINKANTSS